MTSNRISNARSNAPSGFRHVAEQYTISAQQLSHFFRQVMTRPQFRQILLAVLRDAEAEARAEDMRDLLLAAECRKLYMHDRAGAAGREGRIAASIASQISAEFSTRFRRLLSRDALNLHAEIRSEWTGERRDHLAKFRKMSPLQEIDRAQRTTDYSTVNRLRSSRGLVGDVLGVRCDFVDVGLQVGSHLGRYVRRFGRSGLREVLSVGSYFRGFGSGVSSELWNKGKVRFRFCGANLLRTRSKRCDER